MFARAMFSDPQYYGIQSKIVDNLPLPEALVEEIEVGIRTPGTEGLVLLPNGIRTPREMAETFKECSI